MVVLGLFSGEILVLSGTKWFPSAIYARGMKEILKNTLASSSKWSRVGRVASWPIRPGFDSCNLEYYLSDPSSSTFVSLESLAFSSTSKSLT